MRIYSISNTKFTEKEHKPKEFFISDSAAQNAQDLLYKMQAKQTYKENPSKTAWESVVLASLKMQDNTKFTDNRIYRTASSLEQNENISDCTLQLGDSFLNINSKTGKITAYKKHWYTSMRSLIAKAESYLQGFIKDFNNPNIVKQISFGIKGLTQKGKEQLRLHFTK